MINKNQPLWWTLTKMIISFPGSLGILFLSVYTTYWTITDIREGIEYEWYAFLIIIVLYLIGSYLMMVFILGIITLVTQNKSKEI